MIPPSGPPTYLGADTCAECWEGFSEGWTDRWLHRRKWGHNPVPLHQWQPPTEAEIHARNVEGARRYREQGIEPIEPDDGIPHRPQASTRGR